LSSGVRFDQLASLYEHASHLSGDQHFGLHVGERMAPRMYGLVGHIAANARTLGEALSAIVEFQALWSRAAGLDIQRGRGTVRLRYWHSFAVRPEARRQESEQMLAAVIAVVRAILGEPVAASETSFEHAPPADVSEHRRIFGGRLRFRSSSTALVFPMSLLERALPDADPALGGLVRREAKAELAASLSAEALPATLESAMRAAIQGSGNTSLAAVATSAGLHPRTMQRRLREHGLTHRELLERARMRLAQQYLADPAMPLARIAFRLGYTQTSAFHRAFRRHIGRTPLEFRREALGLSPSAAPATGSPRRSPDP
jgi:AraC-like DNA-binding protein